MNYSGYVPGQLQQSNGELHVPTTLRHAHGGQPPGIEMAIPSLSFHHPSELTEAMHRSLGPGLPAPGVFQHQAGGAGHREMDAYAVSSSSSQIQMNPPPVPHASMVHVGPLSDVLPYLTNQSENSHHHGDQRGSAEANVGTIIRNVMQGPTMSSQQEDDHYFRNETQQQRQHQHASEDVLLATATDPQGIRDLHVMQLPKKAHRAHKVRKPLAEGRLNAGGPGVVTSSTKYPTLPGGFKYKLSDNHDGVKTVVGVMSSRVIEMDEKFGPFTGCLLDEEAGQKADSTWEICVRGKVKFYVDGRDKTHKNWMVHVRPACSGEEQNFEAFQSYGDIYYRALDNIQPGIELKVFYCKEYREKIGCEAALPDMTYKSAAETFECKDCRANYKSSKSMMRHMKSHQTTDHVNAPKQRSNYRSGVVGSGVSVGAGKLGIGEATRKLYQYVLHDGGKHDEKLQRNILARKQKEKEEEERKLSPKPSYLKAKKYVQFKRKENMQDREISRIVDRAKVLERLQEKKNAREVVRNEGNNVSKGSRLIGDKDNSIDIEEGPKDLANIDDEDTNEGKEDIKVKSSSKYSLRIKGEDRKLTSSNETDCLTDDHFCDTCGKVFSSSGKLLAHQLFHETIAEFRCKECDFVCKSSRTFHRHKISHYDQPFKCVLCNKKYGYKSLFTRHLKNVHFIHALLKKGFSKYTCCFCTYAAESVKPVARHLEDCENRKKEALQKKVTGRAKHMKKQEDIITQDFIESIPDARTSQDTGWLRVGSLISSSSATATATAAAVGPDNAESKTNLEGTQKNNHGSSNSHSLKCRDCSKEFPTKKNLRNHMRYHQKKHKCELCTEGFFSQTTLMIHMRKHSNERPYKCPLCPRTFSSEKALENHHLEHTDAKPYKCEPCHRSFSSKKQLYKHNDRLHKDRPERFFPCSMCDKKYKSRTTLRKHEESHLGIKHFSCDICKKSFSTKYTVQQHMVTHTGEKPFECKICGKKFSLNHLLDRHAFNHLRDLEADAN